MASNLSAGVVLYRRKPVLQVFLGHMGGPYWEGKEAGAWGIPKGLVDEGEDPKSAAIRECEEECGYKPEASCLIDLGNVKMRSGKRVHAWACEVEPDVSIPGRSNDFEMEWPPKSGEMQSFPEVDRWEWVDVNKCEAKIIKVQAELCARLRDLLE